MVRDVSAGATEWTAFGGGARTAFRTAAGERRSRSGRGNGARLLAALSFGAPRACGAQTPRSKWRPRVRTPTRVNGRMNRAATCFVAAALLLVPLRAFATEGLRLLPVSAPRA